MKFVELQDILLQNCSSKHEGLVVKSSEGLGGKNGARCFMIFFRVLSEQGADMWVRMYLCEAL